MATPKRTPANLERLRGLIRDGQAVTPQTRTDWVQRARLGVAAVYGDVSPQLDRFDAIRYSPTSSIGGEHAQAFAMGRVRQAIGELKAIAEDIELHLEEPEAPAPVVGGLHPWVAEVAARLWNDGHRRQAVQAAGNAVEQWLKIKLDVHDGSVTGIVGTAFSLKDPEEGSPRLRFADVGPRGSDQWKNAHDGAGAFGRGCMMRIRNLYVHNDGASEQADIEALTALSLLARWIDDATVESVAQQTSAPAAEK